MQDQEHERPWGELPTEPGERTEIGKRAPRGHAVIAWIVIVLIVFVDLLVANLGGSDEAGDGTVERILARIQGRYVVGAGDFLQSGPLLLSEAQALNVGSVDQRQRFVVLSAELGGAAAARGALDDLDALIDGEIARTGGGEDGFTLTAEQEEVQRILRRLYARDADAGAAADTGADPDADTDADTDSDADTDADTDTDTVAGAGADADADADSVTDAPLPGRIDVDVLTEDERTALRDRLGWFGDLALALPGGDDAASRATVMASARRAFVTIIGLFGAGAAFGVLGFIGLVVLLVMAALRQVPARIGPGHGHHGIYAETFALWLGGFLVLQIGAGAVAALLPGASLLIVVLAFFASLAVLAWPVWRGISWHDVRHDIGWTAGRRPWLEPFAGVGCYAMTLPLLALGVLFTLGLMAIQALFAGEQPALAPVSGPAHPIIVQLAEAKWWAIFQIMVLASVAAPIVEETMFRGVLYRHLRDASRSVGFIVSVLLSTLVNAFVFAVIHPQGWVAIPALMSLAVGFTLAREWRGSLLPSMIVHGISNGIVLTTVCVLVAD